MSHGVAAGRQCVADGAAQPVQAVGVKPRFGPLIGLTSTQIAAPLLDQKPAEPPYDVVIDLTELVGGVAGTKVVAPATQDRIDIRDHVADIGPDPIAPGAVTHLGPYPGHGPLRRPAMQVVAHEALLLPQPPRHARPEVTTQKIQALTTLTQIDHLRLIRMQPQPQRRQDFSQHR
jgi:hypothetical protein